MNDDRLLLEMRQWLREEQIAMPDAEEAGRQISARLSMTRQRRRHRWWHRFLARTGAISAAAATTRYQPTPVPDTNGHTPTVIWRTQAMFSPAKAITAALVFAIGGVMLIAQPFQQQGNFPGVATDTSPSAPVEVTGSIICGDPVRGASTESTVVPLTDGDMTVRQKRGDAWRQTATMSDPRLEGSYYISENTDTYEVPGAASISVTSGTRRIENDDGAWQGSDTYAYLSDGSITALSLVLDGEGAYEGLTVIWEELSPNNPCDVDVRGLIIEGDVPVEAEAFVGQ